MSNAPALPSSFELPVAGIGSLLCDSASAAVALTFMVVMFKRFETRSNPERHGQEGQTAGSGIER